MRFGTRNTMMRVVLATLAATTLIAGAALADSNVTLTGAGATFPYPIYSKWFDMYRDQTGVKINYCYAICTAAPGPG